MRMKENCFYYFFFSFIDYNTLDNFRLEIASLVLNERTKTMQNNNHNEKGKVKL